MEKSRHNCQNQQYEMHKVGHRTSDYANLPLWGYVGSCYDVICETYIKNNNSIFLWTFKYISQDNLRSQWMLRLSANSASSSPPTPGAAGWEYFDYLHLKTSGVNRRLFLTGSVHSRIAGRHQLRVCSCWYSAQTTSVCWIFPALQPFCLPHPTIFTLSDNKNLPPFIPRSSVCGSAFLPFIVTALTVG